MNRLLITVLFLSLLSCSKTEEDAVIVTAVEQDPRPNILLIVADDLGFSDIGAFGSEIQTPNLDQLAYAGARLTNFHAGAVCSPSRSMLLTGVTSHLAGLGNMAEEMAPNQEGQPGYEGVLNNRVVSVATLLRESGYQTFMTGKWHLGLSDETSPHARGFDRSFAILNGGGSHYADMRAITNGRETSPYRKDNVMLDTLPDNFNYSSEFYVDEMINYIEEGDDERPFFAMLSFTAPHWPLQAPIDAIEKVAGRYDAGYEDLLAMRLAQQKALGLIDNSAMASPFYPDTPRWHQLSDTDKKEQVRGMEIYAAMIEQLDYHTGRLLAHLKSTDQFDNTLIVFLSDNGPEGHDLAGTWPPDAFPEIYNWIIENHDFSLNAMGGPGTYNLYGPGWANASSPAFRLHKAFITEGGTRVPAFVYFPAAGIEKGIKGELLSVRDITPTLLDIAGVNVNNSKYVDETIEPITGISLMPLLTTGAQTGLDNRAIVYELMGKRVVRQGDWKLIHQPQPAGTGEWQLYNLEMDLTEQTNLATQYPDKVSELEILWNDYVVDNNVILPDWVSGY
jgi:arylsulfatase A-like enzyme